MMNNSNILNGLFIFFCFFIGCTDDQNKNQIKKFKDECEYRYNLSDINPLDFLEGLRWKKFENDCPGTYMVVAYPADSSDWVKKSDLPYLIKYLDSSTIPAIPVFSALASVTIEHHGQSTLANEAGALIQGYRSGYYPPFSTIPLGGTENDIFTLSDSTKKDILNWWAINKNN